MATCAICGAETELFISGTPTCIGCAANPKRKLTYTIVNERLSGAREAWRKALEEQRKVGELTADLRGHADETVALRNANRIVEAAAREYQAALREFVQYEKFSEEC